MVNMVDMVNTAVNNNIYAGKTTGKRQAKATSKM